MPCSGFGHQGLLDYEIHLTQANQQRISELEARQKVFECTFRNIRQMRSELLTLQREAHVKQNQIQNFLSAFIPGT